MLLKLVLNTGAGVGIYTIDEISATKDSSKLEIEIRQNKTRIVVDSQKRNLTWYNDYGDPMEFKESVVAYVEIGNKKYKFKDFSEEEITNFIDRENEN